jgi:cysteine desulfurase
VLRALGRSDELAHASLRMTMGRYTTEAEIDQVVATVREQVAKLRAMSPLWEMVQEGVDLETVEWSR